MLKYIELQTGFSHNGPAWIGNVEFSKSGKSLYFNGKCLKSSGGQGIEGNFYDLESGDEYWVSGVKQRGRNRHFSGKGKIQIDRKVVKLYLQHIKQNELNPTHFELVDIIPTDKSTFKQLENEKLDL